MKSDHELALEWKRKYEAKVDSNQMLHFEYFEFRAQVAKALGIQIGRPAWWDISGDEQEQKIIERIKKLRKRTKDRDNA